MTTLLPVHCCCEPARRLGYVEVEGPVEFGQQLRFHVQPDRAAIFDPLAAEGEVTAVPADIIDTEVGEIYGWAVGGRKLAIKSAHRDVQDWRRVHGFRERP